MKKQDETKKNQDMHKTILSHEGKKIVDDIKKMQKNEKELTRKLNQLNKDFTKYKDSTEMILNSYNEQFTTLFLYYDLNVKGVLKYSQDMAQELLNFVANVCKKYDLQFWLDYGSLIGAVRHGNYVPWDDDIDVGMMRKDYEKFLKVIDTEIKLNNLDNLLFAEINRISSQDTIIPFLQLYYKPVNIGKLGSLDIFPYDFLNNAKIMNKKLFNKERLEFNSRMRNQDKREQIFEDYYEKFDLNLNETDYVIPGLDNIRGVFENYKYEIISKDTIFPLKKIVFNGEYYPCPNDSDMYLKSVYGDYIYLPKLIHHHHYLLNDLRRVDNIELLSQMHINKMKIINENYVNALNYSILNNAIDENDFLRIYNLGNINYDELQAVIDGNICSLENIEKYHSKVLGDYIDIPASFFGVGVHKFILKYKEFVGKETTVYIKENSNLLDCDIIYGADNKGIIEKINTGKGQKLESSSEWSILANRSIKITRMGNSFVWTDIPLIKSVKKGTIINMELTAYSECSFSIFFVYNNKGKQSFSDSIRFKKGDYNKTVLLTDELETDVKSISLRVRINDKIKSYLFLDGLKFSIEDKK